MTDSQTIRLVGQRQRDYAHRCIDAAPPDYFVTLKAPTRSLEQNARLWAMLSDIAKAEPMGKKHTSDDWKCIFLRALKYEIRFVMGLDDSQFPVGFSSSRLTVKHGSAPQMKLFFLAIIRESEFLT